MTGISWRKRTNYNYKSDFIYLIFILLVKFTLVNASEDPDPIRGGGRRGGGHSTSMGSGLNSISKTDQNNEKFPLDLEIKKFRLKVSLKKLSLAAKATPDKVFIMLSSKSIQSRRQSILLEGLRIKDDIIFELSRKVEESELDVMLLMLFDLSTKRSPCVTMPISISFEKEQVVVIPAATTCAESS